jgi:hypothetical protein
MIKFFRKIRQKLLSENKLSKYLFYAVGEIVLVVIGILIALNLNNRSDQQKRIAKAEAILQDVMEELATDINASSYIISDYHIIDSLSSLVLDNKLKAEDYAKRGNARKNYLNARLVYLVEGANYYYTSHNAYDVLSNNIGDIPTRFSSLIISLNELYKQVLPQVDALNEKMRILVDHHHADHASNYDWYYQLPYRNSSSAIEYRLHDPKYKNKVRRLEWEGVRTHRSRIVEYRIAAIDCYLKVANILNKPIDSLTFVPKKQLLESYLGSYIGEDDVILDLKIKENHLVLTNTQDQTEKHIYSLTKTDFFSRGGGIVRFEKNNSDDTIILNYLKGYASSSYIRPKN